MKATYTAAELADLVGVSTWSIYESVRHGDCPFPAIRVGRRVVFAKAVVDQALGLTDPTCEEVK
jgi:excisionase family DNA binding protein